MSATTFDLTPLLPADRDDRQDRCKGIPCYVCGRRTSERGAFVFVSWDGRTLLAEGATGDLDSLGYFPVGSECVKRIPAAFRTDRSGIDSGFVTFADGQAW